MDESREYVPGFLRVLDPDNATGGRFKKLLKRYPFISVVDFPDRIYHYTSVEALMGIVLDNGFFMTSSDYLNDSVEITHGRELALMTLDRLSRKHRYSKFSGVMSRVMHLMSENRFGACYVSCFSREADSLEQWRAYCPNGGVNIEISRSGALYGGYLGGGPWRLFKKVIYDDLDKSRLINFVVLRYYFEFIKDYNFFNGDIPDDYEDFYAEEIFSNLESYFPIMKHHAFSSENEVRLVSVENGYSFDPYFRSREGVLIPYIKTGDLIKDHLPSGAVVSSAPEPINITKIVVGPHKRQSLVIESVKGFMSRKGYPNVDVVASGVPYRNL